MHHDDTLRWMNFCLQDLDEFDSNDKDDSKKFIVVCKDGSRGNLAGEVKIAVASFQQTPPEVTPYLILSA